MGILFDMRLPAHRGTRACCLRNEADVDRDPKTNGHAVLNESAFDHGAWSFAQRLVAAEHQHQLTLKEHSFMPTSQGEPPIRALACVCQFGSAALLVDKHKRASTDSIRLQCCRLPVERETSWGSLSDEEHDHAINTWQVPFELME